MVSGMGTFDDVTASINYVVSVNSDVKLMKLGKS